jgi:site-specific recombinase XerD
VAGRERGLGPRPGGEDGGERVSAARTRTRNIMGRDMTPGNEATFRGLVRVLEAAGRSPKTPAAYHAACLSLQRYLQAAGADTDLLSVTREQAQGWLIALQDRGGWTLDADGGLVQAGAPMAKDSVVSYFGSARRFFNWAADEELIAASPMTGMECPPPSGRPLSIPEADLVRAMIASCQPKGRRPSFFDRRDEFMLRLFAETGGPRCSEVANLPVDGGLDMRHDLVTIHGKGGKWRRIAMSAATAQAGSRYLRLRAGHPDAETLPDVFLGLRGPLSADGVYKVVRRRAKQAGGDVHPHQLRHFAADAAKADEMTDGDLMELFGWSTTKMLHRYGREHAASRALAASRRHAIGNRL